MVPILKISLRKEKNNTHKSNGNLGKNWVSSCGLFGPVGVMLEMGCSVVFHENVAEFEGGGLWKIVWGKKKLSVERL
jgi:hypothetical protein